MILDWSDMKPNREAFLSTVQEYIASDPEAAAFVANYVQAGLREALNQALERAADMETLVAILTAVRYKHRDEIVKEKLQKWKGKTALDWSTLVEKL